MNRSKRFNSSSMGSSTSSSSGSTGTVGSSTQRTQSRTMRRPIFRKGSRGMQTSTTSGTSVSPSPKRSQFPKVQTSKSPQMPWRGMDQQKIRNSYLVIAVSKHQTGEVGKWMRNRGDPNRLFEMAKPGGLYITPLHLATQHRRLDIMKMLLQFASTKVNVMDSVGRTAADYARAMNFREGLDVLRGRQGIETNKRGTEDFSKPWELKVTKIVVPDKQAPAQAQSQMQMQKSGRQVGKAPIAQVSEQMLKSKSKQANAQKSPKLTQAQSQMQKSGRRVERAPIAQVSEQMLKSKQANANKSPKLKVQQGKFSKSMRPVIAQRSPKSRPK
jgi:hypothetical protein